MREREGGGVGRERVSEREKVEVPLVEAGTEEEQEEEEEEEDWK